MEETVVDQQALDPACQVQDLPDKLRIQPEVGPIGAIPDLQFLEGYAVLRPPCGMPSQDQTRTQVVVQIEPISSLKLEIKRLFSCKLFLKAWHASDRPGS